MNLIKSFAQSKRRGDATGPLSGRSITFQTGHTVKLESLLGEGGFATIYKATDVSTGDTYAVKSFVLSGDPEAERDVHTEVAIMNALRRSCKDVVLTLHASTLTRHEAFLLLDYCDGTLAGLISSRYAPGGRGFTDEEVLLAFVPVATAVAAMHDLNPPTAHRDVKAENVLHRTNGAWVLCDFGSASASQGVISKPGEIAREEEWVRKHTTPAYRAPELWDLYAREPLGRAVDVWSLGCLLYLLAYGKYPFDPDAKLQILNGRYSIPTGRPAAFESLIRDLLVVNPRHRLAARHAAERAARLLHHGSNAAEARPPSDLDTSTGSAERRTWGTEFSQALTTTTATATAPAQGASVDAFTAEEGWANFGACSGNNGDAVHGQGQPPIEPIETLEESTAAVGAALRKRDRAGSKSSSSALSSRPTSSLSEGAGPSGSSSERAVHVVRLPAGRGTSGGVGHQQVDRSTTTAAATAPSTDTGHDAGQRQVDRVQGSAPGSLIVSDKGRDALELTAAAGNPTTTRSSRELELHEHCRVLEQLLEERNNDIAALKHELREQKDAAKREISELTTLTANLKADVDHQLTTLQNSARELEAENATLKQQLYESQQQNIELADHRRSESSGSRGSRPGSSASGGPVSHPVDPGHERPNEWAEQERKSMPGSPMRSRRHATATCEQVLGGQGGTPAENTIGASRRHTSPLKRSSTAMKHKSSSYGGDAMFGDLDPFAPATGVKDD